MNLNVCKSQKIVQSAAMGPAHFYALRDLDGVLVDQRHEKGTGPDAHSFAPLQDLRNIMWHVITSRMYISSTFTGFLNLHTENRFRD